MLQRLSYRLAINTMVTLLSLVLLFHVLVMTGMIPYEIVWAGKLKTQRDMLRFESISIVINLFLLMVVCVKAGYLKIRVARAVLNVILWLFVCLFGLNTVGNLFAETNFEKVAFTPLTLLFAVLLARIALEKKNKLVEDLKHQFFKKFTV